jgi:N-acyl-D-amino-acid deacylase
MFDLIISGGMIIDGSGKEGYRADVGILKEKISAIGQLVPEMGHRLIHAEHLVVAPGFIDPHTHSDFTILLDPYAESKIRQGVTTEIAGNCGFSVFPVRSETLPAVKDYTRFFPGELTWQWSDYRRYLDILMDRGIACNFASHAGHGMLRIYTMGFSDRPPEVEVLNQMASLLKEALAQGAIGLSLGPGYPPGSYAKKEEFIFLGRLLRSYPRALIAVHLRNEGDHLIDSVEEMIDVARETAVPVHIAHHKAAGTKNWGKVEQTLEMMVEAEKKGIDLSCDVYPYTAGNTTIVSLFQNEAMRDGIQGFLKRLESPGERRRISGQLAVEADRMGGWENIRIGTVKTDANKKWEGKNIGEIAAARGIDEASALMDLCYEEKGAINVVLFYIREKDLEQVMRHPKSMIGSDGKILNIEGPLAEGKPHPRNFGAFPRVLSRYVRERKILSLPEAIRKMTSAPAKRFSIESRGLIQEGYFADLTIFDPERIQDRATFDHPLQYPEGIEYVLVNGEVVLDQGKRTKVLPGKVINQP